MLYSNTRGNYLVFTSDDFVTGDDDGQTCKWTVSYSLYLSLNEVFINVALLYLNNSNNNVFLSPVSLFSQIKKKSGCIGIYYNFNYAINVRGNFTRIGK